MEQEDQAGLMTEKTEFLSSSDLHSFHEGIHYRVFEKLGGHVGRKHGEPGCYFSVWAPNARLVSVAGDFNAWNPEANPLSALDDLGVWTTFVPNVNEGAAYQFHIVSWHQGYRTVKADPFGFKHAPGLQKCSYIWDLNYDWDDRPWIQSRLIRNQHQSPVSIYEVHLGSWMRVPEEENRPLTYRELAPKLADYAHNLGFTHVELMPIMEHSAAQTSESAMGGYFAPDGRFGAPQDLMFLINNLHQRGIGVILDWVAAFFPPDGGGLAYFDGAHLYEHGAWPLDTVDGHKAYPFDYSKPEVRSFLMSSAFFWVEKYHADGLRLGSVASMLYLDFGRRAGEWVPNQHGGRENPDGLSFIRQLNVEVTREFPGVLTFASETSAWPMASHSIAEGGLDFAFKWDRTFVEDVLQYFSHDPFFRKFHHHCLTRRSDYAFTEDFVLPLSHELAQESRSSLLAKMPGDEWQKFANLRLLLGFLYLQPGKKLLFMGSEFAQWQSWNPVTSLDWHLCAFDLHHRMQRWVGDLNHLYRTEPALHESDHSAAGFEWVDANDADQSVLTWLRRDSERREVLLAVCNFTPVVRRNYRAGVRRAGRWREVLNSDARDYGGSGQGNFGQSETSPFGTKPFPYTLTITLPPLAIVIFKHEGSSS